MSILKYFEIFVYFEPECLVLNWMISTLFIILPEIYLTVDAVPLLNVGLGVDPDGLLSPPSAERSSSYSGFKYFS